jgi:hypothetical protein
MNVILKYRGRKVTDAEVAFIRELIAAHPTLTRFTSWKRSWIGTDFAARVTGRPTGPC